MEGLIFAILQYMVNECSCVISLVGLVVIGKMLLA